MSNTVPGMLFTYFMAAVVLAVPACFIVVIAYRRAVRRAMGHRGGGTATAAPVTPRPAGAVAARSGAALAPRTRLALVYIVAGVAAAIVLTAFKFATTDLEWSPFRAFLVGFVYCWPLVLTLPRLREDSPSRALATAVGYVALGALVIVGWSLVSRFGLGRAGVSPLGNLRGYIVVLGITAAAPFAIVLVSNARRLRPVAPMVLAGLLVFSFGALVIQSLFIRAIDLSSLRASLIRIGYLPLFLLASLPMGYLCWRALVWLARRYQAKRSSDTQLLIDAWWLIAIFFAALDLATENAWHALWALLAFVPYRAVVAVGLARWPPPAAQPARLLLLRVFASPRHAERLFDFVASQWRYDGNVNLIGGADLAARTLDPGELLTFIGGSLQSQFVYDGPDLNRRLTALDEARDPDGRFRVNDFFCFDDTWRATLVSLLGRSDVVLMDLRGFTGQNAGCLFEIGKLVEHGKLDRTLFVLDRHSDEKLFQATIAQALQTRSTTDAPTLQITRLAEPSSSELRRLVGSLRGLADATAR